MRPSIITLCAVSISLSALTASGAPDKESVLPNDSIATVSNDSTENPAVELGEFVVEGNTVTMDGKKMTLVPTPRDKKFAYDGIGILQNMALPNVVVDPRTRAVTNAAGVGYTFFIDYVPASAQQVSDIRPQDVLRVEVIESPDDPRFNGARIAANFIMKKYEYGGYTKFNGRQQFPSEFGDYSVYSKLSYRRMTYDISGGTRFNHTTALTGSDSESIYRFGDETVTRFQKVDSYRDLRYRPYVTARAIYSTPGIMISNTIGYSGSDLRFGIQKGSVEYPGLTPAEETVRKTDSNSNSVAWSGMFYFSLPKQFSLNINGSASRTGTDDWSSYTAGAANPIVNDITEKEWNTKGDVTVTKKFGAQSVGASVYAGWRENMLDYHTDALTELKFHESYVNFYIRSSFNIGILNISPNVSASYTVQTFNGKNMASWYPKAYVPAWVRINDRQAAYMSFEYSKGVSSPTEMNPVLVRRNEIDAVEGNEDLEYFDFYLGRLGYNIAFGRFSANVSGELTYFGNIVVPVYEPRYAAGESPMMVQSFANNGSTLFGNAMLRLSGRFFGNSLTVQLYGRANYFHRSGLYARSRWNFTGGADASYYIRNFRIAAGYYTPSLNHSAAFDQWSPCYYYLQTTWTWNGLNITLQTTSPFRKSCVLSTSTIDAGDFVRHATEYNSAYRQNLSLTVTYSFGYGKKASTDNEVQKLEGGSSIILK